MKKFNHNRVLNIVAALLFAVSLMYGSVVQVRAYTALDGYPYILGSMQMNVMQGNSSYITMGLLSEQNSYEFVSQNDFYKVQGLQFGNLSSSFVFPYNYELYDYYIVGTLGFECKVEEINLNISYLAAVSSSTDYTKVSYTGSDLSLYNFNSLSLSGYSFSAKLDELENANISLIELSCISDESYMPACDIWFSASIVPVAKGTDAEQLNQAILNELVKINQNLITANTLQQQTIDAIKDHDTNVGNWFTTLTSNLGNWFQNLYTSMGVGFEKLYQQMTKEQDEQLHGYQDTTTSEAANAFSSESDKLTALEGDLSNQSNQYVSDFTAQGFDLGILATIGSSMVFVTTWFTNFWNMGGIWTAGLNLCFALSIVFFILRFKR